MRKLSAFLVLALLLQIFPAAAQTTSENVDYIFSDVPEYHKNADAIEYLSTRNIIGGYPDKTYKPDGEINRAEFASLLMRSLVLDSAEEKEKVLNDAQYKNCFSDVHDEWFAPYVCFAKGKYLDGHPDGTYRPADKITFAEASKIIAKTFELKNGEVDNEAWYKEFITELESEKAIPLSIEFFDEKITRDEMAEIVYRLKAKISNKASRTFDEISGLEFVTPTSCTELEERYEDTLHIYDYKDDGGFIPPRVPMPVSESAQDSSVANTISKEAAAGSAASYSTTNVQVEGVDEADVVKNDGKYIYLIKGNTIRIVEAYPAENLKELVSYTLGSEGESFYPTEMYVDGDVLAVMGSVTKNMISTSTSSEKIAAPYIYPAYKSRMKIFVLDIADRSKPAVKRSVEFDGYYRTSRKIGDTVYMVMNQYPQYPYYYDYSKNGYVKETENFLPMMLDSKDNQEKAVAACENIRILPKIKSFQFLITAAVPLKDLTKDVTRSVLVANGENVYASTENLYVVSTDWTDGFYRTYQPEQSAIYKFGLEDGSIEYKATGRVPGTVLNQFSMDEHNNVFRIATTKQRQRFFMGDVLMDSVGNVVTDDEIAMSEAKSSNNLYTLDENLKVLGKLENLAQDEQIYSVRFMGNRAYMVTFKQVDPLFVIDVGTPTNPRVLGQLKIPGFSNYLHPYDENHIIGFGKDVNPDAEVTSGDFISYKDVKGLKIGIFDVSDVNNPKEKFKEVIGDQGTESDLLYNHKALLFDKAKNLLAFPITVSESETSTMCSNYSYSSCPSSCQRICMPSKCTYENGVKVCTTDCDGAGSCSVPTWIPTKPVFQGAYVYSIDLQNGLTLKGKITHLNEEEQKKLIEDGYLSNYEKTIQRILYIGENLYTVSQSAVKANDLNSLQEKKTVELAGSTYDYPQIFR